MTAHSGSSSRTHTRSHSAHTKPTGACSEPTQEAIAERAYALWMAAGRANGQDREFWFEAERELRNGSKSAPSSTIEPLPR